MLFFFVRYKLEEKKLDTTILSDRIKIVEICVLAGPFFVLLFLNIVLYAFNRLLALARDAFISFASGGKLKRENFCRRMVLKCTFINS